MNMYIASIISAAILAAAFTYKIQDWRFSAKEKERVEQELNDERVRAATQIRREEAVIVAQNQAQARARSLRLDADGARAAADGLRVATAEALRTAATSHAACTERANTLGELLGAVEEAGRGMAQKADLHSTDLQTLMAAQPKNQEQ